MLIKQERKIIYLAAMFEIEAFGLRGEGICFAIAKATGIIWEMEIDLETDYPELYAQRPKEICGSYWFKCGRHKKERLECLSRAIDLCEE